MQKTIQYAVTSELMWAATAHVRRNNRVVRLVLVCIAVPAIAACCLATSRGNVIVGWILLMISFFAAALFVRLQASSRAAKRRGGEDKPVQTQVTFTDDGIAYENAVQQSSVSWTDVRRVRKTPVYWALDSMIDGREHWIIIPSDAIDRELGSLIDDHTLTAHNH
ncbi:MAG: YcxB family protein [Planctomycetia bacterium]|nr:YcxB family protein [Planctomycetia bacterium]